MTPRRLTRLVVVLFAVTAAGWSWSRLVRRPVAAPPFPCIATAKSGWLTAVTSDTMLRLEWGPDAGMVSVGLETDPVNFKPRAQAEVRALALKVLEPISAPVRSSTSEKVSLFAGCDGVGAGWSGESTRPSSSYRECLRPWSSETRLECLLRIFREPELPRDEAPGAVADRIIAEVVAGGVRLPAPPRSGLGGLGRPLVKPTLIDRTIDFVSPPEPAGEIDLPY